MEGKVNTKNLLRQNAIWLVFLIEVVFFAIFSKGTFVTPNNITNILRQVSYYGIASVGMTFVILIGGIDLSIGSIITLVNMVCAYMMVNMNCHWTISVLAVLVIGVLIGLLNGFMVAKIGIPAMVENVIMRVAIIIYTRTVTSLGETAYATHNVCMNIQALSFMTGQAFATSATSLMGQSLGRRRPDMGEIYAKYTRRMGLVVSLLLALVFFFFGAPIIRLYTDSAAVVETGKYILMFVAFMQPFQSSQFIIAGGLRGAGDTRSIAIIVTLTTLGVRTGFAVLAVNVFQWGLYGAWAALVADQLLRSLLVLMRFNSGKWKTIKVKI